jgi:hypothetical protein
MELMTSKVPRALESKTKLFGFELGDLLFIFFYLTFSNLVFGQTSLKFPVVWLGSVVLAFVLYFVKRDKPDGFLQHYGEFYLSPGIWSAGAPDWQYKIYPPALYFKKQFGENNENKFMHN